MRDHESLTADEIRAAIINALNLWGAITSGYLPVAVCSELGAQFPEKTSRYDRTPEKVANRINGIATRLAGEGKIVKLPRQQGKQYATFLSVRKAEERQLEAETRKAARETEIARTTAIAARLAVLGFMPDPDLRLSLHDWERILDKLEDK